ncbi:MAG: DUF6056 family protein [Prevotella sp.]|jgi:hypothetical protein|nr:DUF6056 family protein [Prevotella sp.]
MISVTPDKKNSIKNIGFVFSVILTGVLFYLLNRHFLPYMDDWGYTFAHTGKKPQNIFEIFQSEYSQYMRWGGRSVVHVIARILLWVGEIWSDVLNAIAYLGLVLLIYFIANRQKGMNVPLFFLINILIWFSLPSFSQNILWITGRANYLWGCLIIYGLMALYVSHFFDKKKKDNVPGRLAVLFGGIIAGWTNENMGIALIFFLLSLLSYLKYDKEKIPKWMVWGLLGVIAGYIVMMLSPGNAYRSQSEFILIHKINKVPLSFYFYRFVTIAKYSCIYLRYPVLIYICSMALFLWKGEKNKEKKKRILFLSLLFLCTSVVATVVMSGSPSFPDRAWFGIIIMLITSIVMLYANIDWPDLKLRVGNYIVVSALVIIYFISFSESYSDLLRFEKVCRHRDKLADEAIQKGLKNIVIEDIIFVQKKSPLAVLDLYDWLILDGSFDQRYGHYKGVEWSR